MSWPNGARAAVSVTIDNMGEAADLNRKLWPMSEPIGEHFTVKSTIPSMLKVLREKNILATYFIESWNINIYEDFILQEVAAAGHEIGWHAWQHEAWSKLSDEDEKANFERSFGPEGIGRWVARGVIPNYRGFRPPGGIINGQRTLALAQAAGLKYISPAAQQAAVVEIEPAIGTMVILPFKWTTVDAYYYMDTFAGLRKIKGEHSEAPQSPDTLVEQYLREIENIIVEGGFLGILFHPFLTDSPARLRAMETVLDYLVQRRDEGKIWIAPCCQVQAHIERNPSLVGTNPGWDLSSWR